MQLNFGELARCWQVPSGRIRPHVPDDRTATHAIDDFNGLVLVDVRYGGFQSERHIWISGSETLGRGRDATRRVMSEQVSRTHARIHWNGENWVVEQLSTTNPTIVFRGGDSIPVTDTEVILLKDDILVMSNVRLTVIKATDPHGQPEDPQPDAAEADDES
jgi:hypothetical protein